MKVTSSVSAFAAYQKSKQKVNGKVSMKKKGSKRKNSQRKLNGKTKRGSAKDSLSKKIKLKVNGIVGSSGNIVEQQIKINSKPAKDENKTDHPKKKVHKKKQRKIEANLKNEVVLKSEQDSEEEPPLLVEATLKSLISPKKLVQDKKVNDSRSEAADLFAWMISPVSIQEFFTKYWEKKTFSVNRSKPDYFKHILSSKDLDTILREHSLFFTRNVDIVKYENGKRETCNPEGKAVPSAVWDYYQNGCSVRILNPHSYNEKVHLLLATLQEYFGTMVGANVYLTPPGSQGFAPHYDDIEAFVIQLEGRKHWKLYYPK